MSAPEQAPILDIGKRVDEVLVILAAAGVTSEDEADGYGGRLDAGMGDGRL